MSMDLLLRLARIREWHSDSGRRTTHWCQWFGLKVGGLRAGAHHLTSADSLAWSARGRRVKPAACGSTTHASEANCLQFALDWREHVQTVIDEPKQLGLTLGGVA